MKRTTNPLYHYEDLWISDHFKKWEAKQSDEFKQYRKMWKECPTKKQPAKFPLSINIEITDVCNAKDYCIMCSKHFIETKNKFMPFETVKTILKEARNNGCYAVNLNGAGEPITHPNVIEIVKYAKSLGFLDIMFHTNATLLTEDKSRDLIEAGLTRLIVSADSHIPSIYKEIRPSFNFEKVYNNVKKFIEIRESLGKDEPIVRLTMVVMKNNVQTIPESIKFWNFVDYITINDCMYFDNFKAFDFNKEKINTEAKKNNLIYSCAPLYQQLSITINLEIISCSSIYAKNNKILGYYPKNSLKDVWEGKDLKELREFHENGKCTEILPCSVCDLPQIELLKALKDTKGKVLVK